MSIRIAARRILFALVLGGGLAGCASTANLNTDPRDPFEGFNRGVYKFNDAADRAVLRPVATAYVDIVPSPVRSCVRNVFNNITEVWSAFNSFLQNRGHDGVNTMGRFMMNSTLGVFGCFDVASENGAMRNRADFGQTLGVWGVPTGPYLVLPFAGPSTVRDTGGLATDVLADPLGIGTIDNVPVRNSTYVLKGLDIRANLLKAGDLLDQVALDPYVFIRDAYLQRRESLVRGGRAKEGDDDLPDYSLPDYEDDDSDPAPGGAAP